LGTPEYQASRSQVTPSARRFPRPAPPLTHYRYCEIQCFLVRIVNLSDSGALPMAFAPEVDKEALMTRLVIVTHDGTEHGVEADDNRTLMETIRERGLVRTVLCAEVAVPTAPVMCM
jgi:hypothetical protein